MVVPEAGRHRDPGRADGLHRRRPGTVHINPVKASITTEGLRVIDSGLEPGQRVIVEGIQLVRPNAKVTVKSRPTSPAPIPGSS